MNSDIDIIDKIIKKEIDVKDLSQDEVTRLTKLCQKQVENLNKRISAKEEKLNYLDKKINEYKKIVNEE